MLKCTSIVGQNPDGSNKTCDEEGIDIKGVIKCKKHWARSRDRADNRLRKAYKRWQTE